MTAINRARRIFYLAREVVGLIFLTMFAAVPSLIILRKPRIDGPKAPGRKLINVALLLQTRG